ncbi:MAG TPA: adenylosuccinate synthetase, partial [Microthrixaceae bacterium]|nr:adenylosuccinate synthetase [Microthrixaceae bacterium]
MSGEAGVETSGTDVGDATVPRSDPSGDASSDAHDTTIVALPRPSAVRNVRRFIGCPTAGTLPGCGAHGVCRLRSAVPFSRRQQMAATIVVGTQWGDEGKGKFTDLIAKEMT